MAAPPPLVLGDLKAQLCQWTQQALLHWTHPETEPLHLLVPWKALQHPWLARAARPQGTPLLRQQMLVAWALAVAHLPLPVLRPQSQLQVKRLEALQ